eukprot:1154174-Pelagomonas_calceolata.AAC.3
MQKVQVSDDCLRATGSHCPRSVFPYVPLFLTPWRDRNILGVAPVKYSTSRRVRVLHAHSVRDLGGMSKVRGPSLRGLGVVSKMKDP